MFNLYKTGCQIEGEEAMFDRAVKSYEKDQLDKFMRKQAEKRESSLDQIDAASSALDTFLNSGSSRQNRNAIGSHNEGEMLLHQDAAKTNFLNGKPSDRANKLNHGMVKTFMAFSTPADPSREEGKEATPIAYRQYEEEKVVPRQRTRDEEKIIEKGYESPQYHKISATASNVEESKEEVKIPEDVLQR